MFVIVGKVVDFDVYESEIFGYHEDRQICEAFVENLKNKQSQRIQAQQRVNQVISEHPSQDIPKQEKYEKLKDYEARIKPVKEANNQRSQALANALASLREELGDLYPDLYHFVEYDFEIVNIPKIEGGTAGD
jgi:chromosome segregation ATPase